jgi:hypothetical protein
MASRLQKGTDILADLNIIPSLFCRDLFYKDVPLFKKQSVVDKVCHFTFTSILSHLRESIYLTSLLMILRQLLTPEGPA